MSKSLREQARRLAKQPYRITITNDETTDGDPIFVLYNPELPGCMAQGTTLTEAQENLADAREEYILSLLDDDLPVPAPEQFAVQAGTGADTVNLSFAIGSNLTKGQEVLPKGKDPQHLTEGATFQHKGMDRATDQEEDVDGLESSIELRQL